MNSVIKKALEYTPIVILLIFCIIIQFSDIPPMQRGFFCKDYTLKYPYIENETIPHYFCVIIWLSLTILIVGTTEIISKSTLIEKKIKCFLLGLFSCLFITDILKYSVGKFRPYFLTLCNPDYSTICIDESAYYTIDGDDEQHFDEFFQKYVFSSKMDICRNDTIAHMKEPHLSFISGHASFSFYFASFLMLYTNTNTTKIRFLKNFVSMIQVLLFIVACWISISRINDYQHHPQDVFLGGILGLVSSFYFNINQFSLNLPVDCESSKSQHAHSTTTKGDVTENLSISSIK